jgi:uncharacterized membrane protein
MGRMQAKDPSKVDFRFAIALEAAKNGASLHQKLGLIRRSPKSIRQHLHRLCRLLQPIEQPGKMEAAFHMLRLHLEQLTVGPHC